jgi:hypothetical protein
MKHKNTCLSLVSILSLSLTGCAFFEKPFEEVITDWSPETTYFGEDRVFQEVSQPKYVKEEVVYQVDSDMELALLAKILFDEGTMMFYVEDGDFLIGKTYAYLDALMIHAFKFSMGTKTYSQGDSIVKSLDYVKIELYNDNVDIVNTAIETFINDKVEVVSYNVTLMKSIHDELILSTQYDTAVLDLDLKNIVDHTPFEAYGLFINHKAVCSGYAKAFMGVVQKYNIPVLTISSNNMNHAWNMVYDGQEWKYVDVTFDDPVPDKVGRVVNTYFMLSLNLMTTGTSVIKAHIYDESSEMTLDSADYVEFATYVFPSTKR